MFKVHDYLDQITHVKVQSEFGHFTYWDTEEEAVNFLIARNFEKLVSLKKELKRTEAAAKKLRKRANTITQHAASNAGAPNG